MGRKNSNIVLTLFKYTTAYFSGNMKTYLLYLISKLVFVIITKEVSGTMLNSLPELPHLILKTVVQNGPYYPCFLDKESGT